MKFCTGCGNRLGTGRFCTACGRPVVSETAAHDTAERPAAPAPTRPPPAGPPPPAYTPPPAPRYPLFSDELFADRAPTAPAAGPPAPPTQRPANEPPPAPPPGRRPGVSWLAVALTVVILALVGVIGGLLLFAGGDDVQAGDDTAQNESSPPASESPPSEPSGPTESASPSSDEPQDVTRFATPSAPKTAKPNLDTQGNLVRYHATNMVDGVPETCWRMAGDGTGTELTFSLSGPTELTEVGLINGYAKRSGKLDWYAGNRRVRSVEWVFDDGTVVAQSLSQSRNLQTLQVDPVTTSTVKLRLVSVSEPGRGPSARNYTPISDVMLFGTPG
ncbi:MAG: hypothetical protein ABWZ91_07455 [Nocardioides sp.]